MKKIFSYFKDHTSTGWFFQHFITQDAAIIKSANKFYILVFNMIKLDIFTSLKRFIIDSRLMILVIILKCMC